MIKDTPQTQCYFFWALISSAVAFVFLSAMLTQYIQEDAFIYFRTAWNLSNHGDFSFNLGEKYPAATSSLYAILIAAHITLFGKFFILTVQFMNSLLACLAVLFLARSIRYDQTIDCRWQLFVFWVVAISPPVLTLATSGMETAIVFLLLSMLVFALAKNSMPVLVLTAFFLPLIRIEAMIALFFLLIVFSARQDWKAVFCILVSGIAGLVVLIASNIFLFGDVIAQTITAKNAAYQPDRSIFAVAERVWIILFKRSFFVGFHSRYIPTAAYIAVGSIAVYILLKSSYLYIRALFEHPLHTPPSVERKAFVACLILVFPLGYAYGGVIFPWYLWPSAALAFFLFAWLVSLNSMKPGTRGSTEVFAVASVTALSFVSLLLNLNVGNQEARYRASVGRYIADSASQEDTLFLEPAGYIPFYAGIKTWDTVGLVSSDVLAYRVRGNQQWWIDFVTDKQPTWIVEREPIHQNGTPDATNPDAFTEKHRDAFNLKYELAHHFKYKDFLKSNQDTLTPIYKLGSHSDYFVYRFRHEGAP